MDPNDNSGGAYNPDDYASQIEEIIEEIYVTIKAEPEPDEEKDETDSDKD